MGLLSSILSIGGAVIGGAVGGPAGASLGASLGGAVGGAVSGSSASSKATKAQLEALNQARQIEGQSYSDVKGYQQPYMNFGTGAMNALTGRLGLNTTTSQPSQQPSGTVIDGSTAKTPGGFAGTSPVEGSTSGTIQPATASTVSTTPTTTTNALSGSPVGSASVGAPAPYVAPDAPAAFSYSADDYKASPGLNYALQTASNNVLSNMSRLGAVESGATLKALSDRAYQIGLQDFNNERQFAYQTSRDARTDYNNDRNFNYGETRDQRSDYDTDTSNLFKALGTGQTATNALSGAATRYGDQVAGLVTQGGQVQAQNALTQGQIGSDLATGVGGLISGYIGNGRAPTTNSNAGGVWTEIPSTQGIGSAVMNGVNRAIGY